MQPLPHEYSVVAFGEATGSVELSGPGLHPLQTEPPVQFGGAGNRWSPETLLVAAVADCFVLTFRAIARASSLWWKTLRCDAEGQLDRVDGVTRFTRLKIRARLTVSSAADTEKAFRLLRKTESACLITNSLALKPELTCHVETMGEEEFSAEAV